MLGVLLNIAVVARAVMPAYTGAVIPTFLQASLVDILPSKSPHQDILVFKLFLGFIIALVIGVIINKGLKYLTLKFLEARTKRTKKVSKRERILEVKRAETLLSVGAALARVAIIGLCLYIAWRIINPSSAPVALIGAGTFFIVLGAATIGPLLRDVTSGILMVTEHWYNVGDHISVDPFWDLDGVVEQMSLRSTKIRTIKGQSVWIHNQYIQAVRVTNNGTLTISVDTFVNNLDKGRQLIKNVLEELPTGSTMIAVPLAITEEEQLGNIWRITITGQTAPGRGWLIETFAVEAIKVADQKRKIPVIVHGPIVRYTDKTAEKHLKRSML